MDYATILFSLASAFVGTFFGTYWIKKTTDKKMKHVRDIAISCLNMMKEYCKKENTYQEFQNEFNNKYSIANKRAFLVVLHKIGIPVEFATEKSFDVKNVSFLPEKIDGKEIEDMISQIRSGQCDHLFFLDPDTYFNENGAVRKKRSIAIKFIDKAMADSVGQEEGEQFVQRFPVDWTSYFSPGEINVISVFRKKLCNPYYYKSDGKVKNKELDRLREEVNIGIWDYYFSWDIGAFENMYSQRISSDKSAQLFDAMLQQLAKNPPSNL
ncbi:hypothetical protein [Yersinia ruckeri]|uniref:hypothetical protein n=1 Tax=Yersinia ruckeri TaxID=29486 RepID=UPI002237F593|nr:hypothetical protein [Yersinia ruckeri]EKN3347466.1 hypothetical protein [Yersinia ruckeri]EKN4696011.1 hypothetical protein [Yersinia ruckeri]MCW6624029.1 hypothetical protein [Yersinia ruckeri]